MTRWLRRVVQEFESHGWCSVESGPGEVELARCGERIEAEDRSGWRVLSSTRSGSPVVRDVQWNREKDYALVRPYDGGCWARLHQFVGFMTPGRLTFDLLNGAIVELVRVEWQMNRAYSALGRGTPVSSRLADRLYRFGFALADRMCRDAYELWRSRVEEGSFTCACGAVEAASRVRPCAGCGVRWCLSCCTPIGYVHVGGACEYGRVCFGCLWGGRVRWHPDCDEDAVGWDFSRLSGGAESWA